MYSNNKAMRFASSSFGERGFGLIEAMVSIVLLTIGILAIASGEVQTLTMQKKSREKLTAASIAANMVELIRRNPAQVSAYNNLNTEDEVSLMVMGDPLVAEDFKYFNQAVATGLPGESVVLTGGESIQCNGQPVKKACGWVTVQPAPFQTIMGTTAQQVTVQIVWAGMPNGIQVTGVIPQ